MHGRHPQDGPLRQRTFSCCSLQIRNVPNASPHPQNIRNAGDVFQIPKDASTVKAFYLTFRNSNAHLRNEFETMSQHNHLPTETILEKSRSIVRGTLTVPIFGFRKKKKKLKG